MEAESDAIDPSYSLGGGSLGGSCVFRAMVVVKGSVESQGQDVLGSIPAPSTHSSIEPAILKFT